MAISFLWYKLENVEEKGDGKDIKAEQRADRLQREKDSLQVVRAIEWKKCYDEIQRIKEQEIEDLKQRIAEQNEVKSRVQRTERTVNRVITQTKTKLNPIE